MTTTPDPVDVLAPAAPVDDDAMLYLGYNVDTGEYLLRIYRERGDDGELTGATKGHLGDDVTATVIKDGFDPVTKLGKTVAVRLTSRTNAVEIDAGPNAAPMQSTSGEQVNLGQLIEQLVLNRVSGSDEHVHVFDDGEHYGFVGGGPPPSKQL